jgi:lysozyme family protein
VGVKADGIIGPATLAAVQRAWDRGAASLLVEYCARRAVHYSSLSLVIRYGLGWFRRLFDVHRAALDAARNTEATR